MPNQWGEFRLRLENHGDGARNLLCTTYFDEYPTNQFGRQIWIPGRSRLVISHPVRLPILDTSKGHTTRVHSLVIDDTEGKEVLVKDDAGQLRHDRSLVVNPSDRNTGIIAGWENTAVVPEDVLDLVVASRVSQSLLNKVSVLGGQFLPADQASYDYLDHLIVADDRLANDSGAITAVRSWLHAGGNLWVMLDRADPLVLERLLGDEFACRVVDRVGLTTIRIDKAPNLIAPNGEPGPVQEFEVPVTVAQVLASGMKIHNTINGWPASMSFSYGDGRVLITTVGPRAWVNPTPEAKRKANSLVPGLESAYVPSSPMENLAAYVLARREPKSLQQSTMESLARERVSYKVPGWGLIAGTMSSFLILLIGTALILQRMDCLEHFGWGGSLLAMIFGMILAGIGVSNRYGVPGTAAGVHLVQAIAGTDDIRAKGVMAVYRPEGGESQVKSSEGGELWPAEDESSGLTRRMITTDFGTYRWDGLPPEAGLRLFTDTISQSFVDRIEATATLNSEGIVGQYSGVTVFNEDALLATRNGRIGVSIGADGSFTARAEDVLNPNQYLHASYLGDTQDRRQRILQELFTSSRWKTTLEQPHLLLWMDHWKPGYDFGQGLTEQGDTLLALRLNWSRPQPGTEVLIPASLISFSTRRPPDGSLPTGFWDDVRKEWQERSSPSTTWLKFQIPREFLPLVAQKARLEIKVSGAIGQLEILGIREGVPVSLQRSSNPASTMAFDISDEDILMISDDGELSLGISGGESSTPQESNVVSGSSPANYWRVESLAVQVWAKAADAGNED